MKYKRRKTAVSKYISQSKQKGFKKKLPKTFLILLSVFIISSMTISYFPRGYAGLSKTFSVIRSVSEDISSYIAGKMSFMSKLGKKGAYFCFEYIRNDEKNTALAVSSVKEEENKEKNAVKTSNIENDTLMVKKEEVIPVFSPSLPCRGEISSPFGDRVHPLSGEKTTHNGIDLAVSEGTDILTVEDGTVEKSEYNQFSGNYVVIGHQDGYTSSYAHLSRLCVEVGDSVTKGDIIGISGSTGAVTGPHLHMEIRKDGIPVDPMSLIKVN